MLLAVDVPAGLRSGDVMSIEAGGKCFEVCVPDGVREYDRIEVDLPAEEDELNLNAEEELSCRLSVPDGVREGETFSVESEWGTFEVCCPDGCGGGDEILVNVPQELVRDGRESSASMAPTGGDSCAVDTSHHRFRPGQRVEVLRSNGKYDLATINLGYDCLFDVYYEVRLDCSQLKPAVPEEEIFEVVDAPPECADARFRNLAHPRSWPRPGWRVAPRSALSLAASPRAAAARGLTSTWTTSAWMMTAPS